MEAMDVVQKSNTQLLQDLPNQFDLAQPIYVLIRHSEHSAGSLQKEHLEQVTNRAVKPLLEFLEVEPNVQFLFLHSTSAHYQGKKFLRPQIIRDTSDLRFLLGDDSIPLDDTLLHVRTEQMVRHIRSELHNEGAVDSLISWPEAFPASGYGTIYPYKEHEFAACTEIGNAYVEVVPGQPRVSSLYDFIKSIYLVHQAAIHDTSGPLAHVDRLPEPGDQTYEKKLDDRIWSLWANSWTKPNFEINLKKKPPQNLHQVITNYAELLGCDSASDMEVNLFNRFAEMNLGLAEYDGTRPLVVLIGIHGEIMETSIAHLQQYQQCPPHVNMVAFQIQNSELINLVNGVTGTHPNSNAYNLQPISFA